MVVGGFFEGFFGCFYFVLFCFFEGDINAFHATAVFKKVKVLP